MSWFYYLFTTSISVTPLILLLLWLAPRLNKRYSARFRTLLWLIIALRLLMPVSLPEKSQLSIPLPIEAGDLVQLPAINLAPNLDSTDYAGSDTDPLTVLLIVYLLGVAVLLTRELLAYVNFRHDVLRWAKRPPPEMEDRLQELKTELGISGTVSLQISRNALSPMVSGLLRPVLLLPAQDYPDDELRLIMTHELIHLKHHDIAAKLLLALTTAMHWFNPAVHIMAKAVRQDMELACDDQVVKHSGLDEKKRYCILLLELAQRPGQTGYSVLSTPIGGSKETLETRIKGIFDGRRKRRGIAELAVAALLVLVGGAAVNWSGTEPWNSQPFSASVGVLTYIGEQPIGTGPVDVTESAVGSRTEDMLASTMEDDQAAPTVSQISDFANTQPTTGPGQQKGGGVTGDVAPPVYNSGTQSDSGAEVVVIDLLKLSGGTNADLNDNQTDPNPADTNERQS